MTKRIWKLLFAGLLTLSLIPACGDLSGPELEADDPELQGLAPEGEDGKADSSYSTSTYYLVRRDLRRCVYPYCGGYWVHRVNQPTTRCVDGVYAAECYVSDILYTRLGLSARALPPFAEKVASGKAVVRGTFSTWYLSGHAFAKLQATEGWQAATDKVPTGTFYRAWDNGVRCITYPCFTIHEAKLNSTISTNLSGVNLENAGAPQDVTQKGYDQLFGRPQGLIIAGVNRTVPRAGPAGDGRALVASQFYFKVAPVPSAP
jgi:hypothetical protein